MSENKVARIGAAVIIVSNGKVLLGHRHPDPEKASSELHGEGTWTLPGGKVDFGDTLLKTAKKEALEECGIQVDELEIISIADEIIPDKHFVTVGFVARKFSGEPKVMEPDEITEWNWFDLNKLPSPIFPPSYKMIKNYLDKTLYRAEL